MILTITLNAAIDKTYTVEGFYAGGNFRPSEMHALPGGKGLNVSRAAKALGRQVTATGFIGGYNGAFIEDGVKEMGVCPEFVYVDGESRICIAVLDPQGGITTEIWEKGPTISSIACEKFMNKLNGLIEQANVVTASGSLPQGVADTIYADIAASCRRLEKPFILDTSGRALAEGIKGKPTMIKPNVHELETLLGKNITDDDEIISAAEEIAQNGIDIVAVSMGEKGSLVWAYGQVYKVKAPCVEVVDAVGSGDSMVAGYAAGIEMGYSVKDMIKLGAACATANVLTYGAGTIEPDTVQCFFDRLEICDIKR
ncbi:MAG: tagatose 6-phosphate kinase [Clostridiales bacterium]|nr:tagatose 6-phosphate kinase [Clostridiales bacterium]